MISIIIPVFNAEQCLAAMLDSILNQTYKDIELLLVNDGSSDRSGKICHQYAGQYSYITVYDCENNGASAARNFGLCKAQGEFIWFMDSDDILHTDALEIAIKVQQENNADVVIGGMNFCFNEWKKIKTKSIDSAFQFMNAEFAQYYAVLFLHNYISPLWNKLIRRSVMMQNTIWMQKELMMYEDYAFCMDLLVRAKSIVCVPDIFYDYQLRNSGSLSHRYKPEVAEMLYILKTRIFQYIEVFAHKNQEADMRLNNLVIYLAYECVKNEFSALENPKQKIKDLLYNKNFCDAMQQFRGYGLKYRIVHTIMNNKMAVVLSLYLKWDSRKNR